MRYNIFRCDTYEIRHDPIWARKLLEAMNEYDNTTLTLECEKCGAPLTIKDAHHVSAIQCWPRPIPVTERLPDEGLEVLAYDGSWWVANRWCNRWEEPNCHGLQDVPVTHWLPLPPKP
jgi:hypothetical protein